MSEQEIINRIDEIVDECNKNGIHSVTQLLDYAIDYTFNDGGNEASIKDIIKSNNAKQVILLKQDDNWNKLKEYLNTNTAIFHDEVDMFQVWKTFKAVLDKMKELEGYK